jgi:hypothetical protein
MPVPSPESERGHVDFASFYDLILKLFRKCGFFFSYF